ncbi:MAG TPA: winged helix-turn-helix domain-containing protein [Terracidiphilus sp.]|jgi:DNA-binding winged helix-turn-helix (wHTH) protein|nr:winged helix-turn-helix domain-containing protein [Terracidiphilus sp.]
MTELQPARRYRFGAFEADAETGELRRQGILIKLPAQPFQMLLLLLERPGQLLTREEISRELWPDGTFVDYEHGVNSAVNRIREALGDSAGNSRFVQTLARRGYRFVAPVERIPRDGKPALSAAEFASGPVLGSETAGVVARPAEPEGGPFSRILARPEDLPKTPYPIVQALFLLMQLMYVGFYVGALANLAEIEELLSPLPKSTHAFTVLIVSAAIMIPVRAFVFCAVLFHAPGVREKFLRLWPFLLALDVLWSLSPFLLLHHINFGLALACTTLLVYSPFAQRSLILMGAGVKQRRISETAR